MPDAGLHKTRKMFTPAKKRGCHYRCNMVWLSLLRININLVLITLLSFLGSDYVWNFKETCLIIGVVVRSCWLCRLIV